MMRRRARVLVAVSLLGGGFGAVVGVPVGPAAAAPLPCDATVLQQVIDDATTLDATVVSASDVDAPSPHCRVDGTIVTEAIGAVSAPNTVRWMVAMPTGHNGRYFFQGLGGTAGVVPNPTPALLAQGYVFAGTDTGSDPNLDWGFMFDPTRRLDHDNRGGHVSAVVTQAITRAYYDIDTLYRYHAGCSGGGRMGRSAAGLHPEDYDGIVIGAPGRSVGNVVHFGKVAQYLWFTPGGRIPSATLAAIGAEVLADWDGADGAIDGIIWDPSVVEYSAAELDELLSELTPEQRTTVDMILAGFDIGANVRMNPYPVSSIGLWSAWVADLPGFPYPFVHRVFDTFARGSFGPTFDFITQFDFTSVEQVNQFAANFAPELFSATFEGEDFLPFRDSGGKIVYWHGAHDNVISGFDLQEYHAEIVSASGGEAAAADWFRSFWVPGVSHCGGGTGPQDSELRSLDALANWVENGVAPSELVLTRPADGRTFRVCTYPDRSVFAGGLANPDALDVNDAGNWACEARTDGYHPIVPVRAADTRDGTGVAEGPVLAGEVLEVPLADVLGVPDRATGVVLNVTAANARGPGYLSVFPCGERPYASSVNYEAEPIANLVVVGLGNDGDVCVFAYETTDVIIDVSGWYEPGVAFTPTTPRRIVDTRDGLGGVAAVPLEPADELVAPVTPAVGVPEGATAVSVSLTLTNTTDDGYATMYPCGLDPYASNVNYVAGQIVPNAVVVGIGADDAVCVRTSARADVVVDLNGYLGAPGGVELTPVVPVRVADTRDGTGGVTRAKVEAGKELAVQAVGAAQADDVLGVVINLTGTNADDDGYLAAYACGTSPYASNVNYVAGDGRASASAAFTPVDSSGRVCITSSARADVVVDLIGVLG